MTTKGEKIELKALCIIVHKCNILAFAGHDDQAHRVFRLPGGGIKFGEESEHAVRREIREEFKSELNNLAMVGVKEDLFSYRGLTKHQIIFLFKANFADRSLYEQKEIHVTETHSEYQMVWISLSDVINGTVLLCPSWDYQSLAV